jgi:molecular chaperone GrpE
MRHRYPPGFSDPFALARPRWPERHDVHDDLGGGRGTPAGDDRDPPHAPPASETIARLEAELADRDRRIAELGAQLRERESEGARSSAEVASIRARLERESRREIDRRLRDVVEGWLGAIDDLDRAIAAGRSTDAASSLLEGVEHVRRSLLARLAEQGIRPIVPTAEPFDPRLHDGIARVAVADPAHDGVVIETALPGYQLGEELIRPARVVVGWWQPPVA